MIEIIFESEPAFQAKIAVAEIKNLTEDTLTYYQNNTRFGTDGLEEIGILKRKIQWYAARDLLSHLTSIQNVSVVYDEFGKPHLEDGSFQISLSHSGKYVAAAIDVKNTVGIDIQNINNKIERIAKKFIREEEFQYINGATSIEHMHVVWGAKESLYKLYGKRRLDFKAHMILQPFNYEGQGVLTGRIAKDGFDKEFQVYYKEMNSAILVYAINAD